MYVSLENDPLLFVHGPPVYRHVPKVSRWQEESTSIFPEPLAKAVEIDPLMWKRLLFLKTDLAKHVYKPLCFQFKDGEKICGAVDALHLQSVQIRLPEGELVAVEIQDIQEIWWRGKILPVRI